jgi:hypothetical protein
LIGVAHREVDSIPSASNLGIDCIAAATEFCSHATLELVFWVTLTKLQVINNPRFRKGQKRFKSTV